MTERKVSKILSIFIMFLVILSMETIKDKTYAAGTKNLVSTLSTDGTWKYNSGYRVFTEWLNDGNGTIAKTAGIDRVQKIYAYANKGDYIYFGSSMINTQLNDGYEIVVTSPDGKTSMYNVEENGQGNINTSAKELNGPNYGAKTDGYDPFSIYVDGVEFEEGVYEFQFYSYNGADSKESEKLSATSNTSFKKYGGRVASWDVTVVEESDNIYTEKTGRVWANYLALCVGGNFGTALNSILYVLTSDGYVYKVDLNDIDPWGFIFFANNRGLIDTSNNTSLYKSVYASDNDCSNPHYTKYGNDTVSVQFHKPNTEDTKYDKTYKVFFENPSDDLPKYIKPDAYEPGAITDIKFTGINCSDNVGRVGEGGYFHFTVSNASSYEIKLNFEGLTTAKKDSKGNYILDDDGNKIYERVQAVNRLNKKLYKELSTGEEVALFDSEYNANPDLYEPIYIDGIVYLRNSCVDGQNSVYWDGRDEYGHFLPKGSYGGDDCNLKVEITAKAGEYHFIMIDVENNYNGTKVEMISDVLDSKGNIVEMSDEERNTAYYNNYNDELLLGASKNDETKQYCSADSDKSITGVDTREVGASAFKAYMGNESLIDIWSYVTRQSSEETEIAEIKKFTLVATDLEDPGYEEEQKGTVSGLVFYDSYADGGSMTESEGDFPLEDVEVNLYRKVFNEAEGVYEYIYAATTRTNEFGKYYFSNVETSNKATDSDNCYEVRVAYPNKYAECTTNNQIITDIEVIYDENDLSKLDVVNDDVGFYWDAVKPIEKEKFGTIEGTVYYDNDRTGGQMDESLGDYPLENIEVILYKKVYNETTRKYDVLEIDTTYTDSSGKYSFEKVTVTNRENDSDNYYEVRVTPPGEYVECTTNNQIISNIKVDLDENDLSKLNVLNDDVGYYYGEDTPTNPTEYTGTISGRVYYDYDESGGTMNLTNGDYPLDEIEVLLYRKIYNSTTDEYDEIYIESSITDSLGNYYFGDVTITNKESDPDNYYEVRVSSPNIYAECTTDNQIISNIRVELDENDISKLDVIEDDVGFYWSPTTVTIKKGWAIKESVYPKVKINLAAYKVVDNEYVIIEELGVNNQVLSSSNGWVLTLNLPAKDSDGNNIIYYIKDELVYQGKDENGKDIWVTPQEAGYDNSILPPIEEISPTLQESELKIINSKSCLKIEKNIDEIAKVDTTFTFLIVDNGNPDDSNEEKEPDKEVTITIPAGSKYGELVSTDVIPGHNYTVKEINIPQNYELDENKCELIVTKLNIDDIIKNTDGQEANDEFSFNFRYDSTEVFTLHFENKYKKQNIEVSKIVAGDKGDTTKDFEFKFNIDTQKGYNAIKTKNDGTQEEITLYNDSKFYLKHNEKIEITNLPIESEYIVTETDYTSLGYITTVNDALSNKFEGTVSEEKVTINFVNTLNHKENLGVKSKVKPIIIVVISAGIFAFIYVIISQKKKRLKYDE